MSENVKITIGDITFNGPPEKVAETIVKTLDSLDKKQKDPKNNSVFYNGISIRSMLDTQLRYALIEILSGYIAEARKAKSLRELMDISWPVESYKAIGIEISKRAAEEHLNWL